MEGFKVWSKGNIKRIYANSDSLMAGDKVWIEAKGDHIDIRAKIDYPTNFYIQMFGGNDEASIAGGVIDLLIEKLGLDKVSLLTDDFQVACKKLKAV